MKLLMSQLKKQLKKPLKRDFFGLGNSQFGITIFICCIGITLTSQAESVRAQEILDQESLAVQEEANEQKQAQEEKEKAQKEAEEKEEQEEKEKKEEEKKKEKQEELEDDAKELEEELTQAQKEKQQKQEILNSQYNQLSEQRYALEKTKDEVDVKESEISAKDAQIETLEKTMELNRAMLSATMRQLYFVRDRSIATDVFESKEHGQFLLSRNSTDTLRERLVETMGDLKNQGKSLDAAQKTLKQAKKEKEELLSEQQKQEQKIASSAAQTTIQVKEVEATISQINGKLAGIQSDLSALLGVGVSTDDIVEAAEFASKKTGVRKAMLLGMLIVETDLGRFTGGCTYSESNMNDVRKAHFKDITKELGYDYKKMKVSCPPSNYKGTGGAMGVAQFMSDTWVGYRNVIAKRTGNNPPDPWSLTDGVMAMASKLANDGATKNGRDGEWKAAARYLGSCTGNTKFYCENVLYWADNYDKKL